MTHQQATPTAAQIIEACQRVPSARPSAEETQVLIAEIVRLRSLLENSEMTVHEDQDNNERLRAALITIRAHLYNTAPSAPWIADCRAIADRAVEQLAGDENA